MYETVVRGWYEKMGNQLFHKIGEVSELIKIPHQTVRRYISKHGHHLSTKKQGKSVLVAEESLETLKIIKSLYDDGKVTEEVDSHLASNGVPMTITVPDESEKMVRVDLREVLVQQQSQIESLHEKLEEQIKVNHEQSEINKQVLEEVKSSKEWQRKRDENLMEVMRELLEVKKQTAIALEAKNEPEPKKKGFFSRLLGK